MLRYMPVDLRRLDRLDRRIIAALRVDPRASFRRVATVLGSSEQTVARRYRAMVEDGVMRIVVLRRAGWSAPYWYVRVRVAPAAAAPLADALARRRDVSWVSLVEGGAEVACAVRPSSAAHRDELLLQRLPRMAQVTGVEAASVLHRFDTTLETEWLALPDGLDTAETAELDPALPIGPPPEHAALDDALADALTDDPRATLAELAARTGAPVARATRRLATLRGAGVLVVEAEVAEVLTGFDARASLWLTVTPAHLEAAGRALSLLPEVAYCAAVSGRANLLAQLICRDSDELYRLLTGPIGELEGLMSVETSMAVRRVKQEGSLVVDGRLARVAD